MQYRDYYKIMGVDKKASQDEIKQTYRKLAKKYHPDTNPGDKKAEEKFKEINEAYEVLGDSDKRKKYDALGSGFNFRNGYDFDPSQYGFGNNVRYEYTTSGNSGFSDFFNAFFGGGSSFDINDIINRAARGANTGAGRSANAGRGGNTIRDDGRGSRFSQQYTTDGEDAEAEIEITPEEGFAGDEKRIGLRTGASEKTISFRIPAGIRQGEKIKLSGQGNPGMNGGKNGDLYLKVNILSGSRFKIDNSDLHADVDLTPWEAALGEEVPFETIDGKIIVKIPPGVQTGSKIRVAGKGYRDKKGRRGDLFITVRIINPTALTRGERELYEKLRQVSKFKPSR